MIDAVQWLFSNEPIRWVQQLFGPGHPLPFRIFSLLGDTWGILFVVGFGFWLFGRRVMYSLVAIVAVGAATKLLMSSLFSISRPSGPEITVYEHLEVGSFPSGHVYEAVAPWGSLYVLGCVPLWVPTAVAVLVGLGRLYLGVHYLADVLAGVAFGAVLVWIHAATWPAVREWLSRRGWAFHATLALVAIAGTLTWMTAAGANPRRYEIIGMILGAAAGLPLEYRYLQYEPGPGSWTRRAGRVFVGLLGIAAFLLWDRSRGEEALLLGTLTAGLATLWTVVGAPALFVLAGAGKRSMEPGTAVSRRSADVGREP